MPRVRFYIRCPWCGLLRAPEWISSHIEISHPDVYDWISWCWEHPRIPKEEA